MKATCLAVEAELRNGKKGVILVCSRDVLKDELPALKTFCDLSKREIIDVLKVPKGYLRSMLPPLPVYPTGPVCVTCKETTLFLSADELVVSKCSNALHKLTIFIDTDASLDWLVGKELDVAPINKGGY